MTEQPSIPPELAKLVQAALAKHVAQQSAPKQTAPATEPEPGTRAHEAWLAAPIGPGSVLTNADVQAQERIRATSVGGAQLTNGDLDAQALSAIESAANGNLNAVFEGLRSSPRFRKYIEPEEPIQMGPY